MALATGAPVALGDVLLPGALDGVLIARRARRRRLVVPAPGALAPGQTTPSRRRAAISPASGPSSARTSSVSWPSSGGGVRIVAGVADSRNGIPDLPDDAPGRVLLLDGHPEGGRLGRRERLDDVVDRRARDLGRLERGKPGRPVALGEARGEDRPQHCPVLDAVAVDGEARVRRPGPSARAPRRSRRHCRSEPTATAIAPSAVSNVSYGTMFGCAFPRRPGATPVTKAFCAWLTRLARVAPSSEMSIRWPGRPPAGRPLARAPPRPTSAASTLDGAEHPGHDVADRDARPWSGSRRRHRPRR